MQNIKQIIQKYRGEVVGLALLFCALGGYVGWDMWGEAKAKEEAIRQAELQLAQVKGEIAMYNTLFRAANSTGELRLREIVEVKEGGQLVRGEDIYLQVASSTAQ